MKRAEEVAEEAQAAAQHPEQLSAMMTADASARDRPLREAHVRCWAAALPTARLAAYIASPARVHAHVRGDDGACERAAAA